MKARTWAVVAGALIFAGCQSLPPPASEAERDESMAKLGGCLRAAAAQLDDHVSDARSVGIAVGGACNPQFQASLEVAARGMNPVARLGFLQEARDKGLATNIATGVVLASRAGRYGPQVK